MHSKSIGNLLTQVMATNQITTIISQELFLLRDCAGALATTSACTKRSRKQARSRTANSSSTMSQFKTPLGTMIIRKHFSTATSSNGDDSSVNYCTRDENTWIFIPSFFSRCIDFRYWKTWGGIQGALRTYPVLQNNHPVWDMVEVGDVTGIQKLFSERKLSPFSIHAQCGFTPLDVSSYSVA